jgi:outer membrane protein
MGMTMRTRSPGGGVGVLLAALGALVSFAATDARAQPAAPPPAPAPAAPSTAPATGDDTAPLPVPTELARVQAGGLTAEQAGARAAATSWNAKASLETLRGAVARADEAWASYLPRLSGIAKYTRLSNFTPPSLGNIVGTTAPPGADMINNFGQLQAVPFSFPIVLDNWLFQATLTVPISDYFLRIDQNYTAATRSEEAARWDVVASRAGSDSNGKVAYYTWLRERAAILVEIQALNAQRTHLRDARNQFSVGNASKADVLRAETAVASAELALERAKNLAALSEKQVRVAVHAPDEEVFGPGEDLDTPLPPVQGSLKQMTLEAFAARPEIKSADANADAARKLAAAAKAGRYPTLSAFADGIVANPNPRYFPPSDVWFPTWDLGAQLTWTPNDILVANGSVADSESRAAAIEANEHNVRDGIEIELTQQWQAVHEADFSIEAATRELASAEEAYRVARELFNNGRGTATTLTDAENDLTRARFDLLNAKTDARIARVRLEHALGRDAKPAGSATPSP